MTNNMPFRRIIIPTFATPAANQLPNLNPLDSTIKWLASAVTRLALSRRTVMIDRALAEDLAAAFEVDVEKIPLDISGAVDFVCDYVSAHAKQENLMSLKFRLQVVSGRLYDMIAKMASSFDG
jgi:hypothetical protein